MITSRLARKQIMAKNSYMTSIFSLNSRKIHTIGVSNETLEGAERVSVYSSKEYEGFKSISQSKWYSQVARSNYKTKYLELMPFFVEARWRTKCFVLKMDLLPDHDYLRIRHLAISGIYTKYLPLKYIVPITKNDYACLTNKLFFKQSPILDLDMIYGHFGTREMYLFDKHGEWHEEGLEHDRLSLENTYNETNWYDEFTPDTF